jgi:D-serine deaminase-like pyridoxal phosphate-dependent protein
MSFHSLRVKLRPHIKTHKTLEILRMQLDDGGSGICVGAIASTLPEVLSTEFDETMFLLALFTT